MNGAIIPTNNICYKEVTVSVSANSNVPPWTYYGATLLGLSSSDKVIGIACMVADSSVKAIATYRVANDTLYVYSFSANDVVVGITYASA